jgi:glycosyltransferase involved in cell wall biosynthesis
LKIFYIHCFYNKFGGEDSTFISESNNFKDKYCYSVKNKYGIYGLLQFILMPFNFFQAKKIINLIKLYKPDIIHVHNFHFALGPLFIRYIKLKTNIPLVITFQNYRLISPSATFLINGQIDLESLETNFPWHDIVNASFKNSKLLTFWIVFSNWLHLKMKTWSYIDLILVQTNFSKEIFRKSKLKIDPRKILVKPNSVKDFGMGLPQRNNRFLFIGRLSEEKGLHFLIDIAIKLNIELDIIGDGPLKNKLEAQSSNYPNIVFHGFMDKSFIIDKLKSSSAMLFTSIWFEGMPITILEAFSTGTVVFSSNIGAMSEIIIENENGFLINPMDYKMWASKINDWISMPDFQKQIFSENARRIFIEKYSSDINKSKLEKY